MRKKVFVWLLLLVLLVALTYILCLRAGEPAGTLASRFKVVYDDSAYRVIVDQRTGVEYIWTPRGGICALIDSYGNPVLYPAYDAREDRPV